MDGWLPSRRWVRLPLASAILKDLGASHSPLQSVSGRSRRSHRAHSGRAASPRDESSPLGWLRLPPTIPIHGHADRAVPHKFPLHRDRSIRFDQPSTIAVAKGVPAYRSQPCPNSSRFELITLGRIAVQRLLPEPSRARENEVTIRCKVRLQFQVLQKQKPPPDLGAASSATTRFSHHRFDHRPRHARF